MLKRPPNKIEQEALKTFVEKRKTKSILVGSDDSKMCRSWNALQKILPIFHKKDGEALKELYETFPPNFKEEVLTIYKENGINTKTFKLVKIKEKGDFQWPWIF